MKRNQSSDGPTKPTFADDKKFTVADLARDLNKCEKTIRSWIKARRLKAYRFDGKFIVTASQYNEFAATHLLEYSGLRTNSKSRSVDLWKPLPVEVEIDDLSHNDLWSATVSSEIQEWILEAKGLN